MLLIDEIAGQAAREVGPVPTARLTITVRELLHMRVELEWRERSEPASEIAAQVSVPEGSHEARLNHDTHGGVRGFFAANGCLPADRQLAGMCTAAEQAFCDQRIFVLLDDSQAESLDQVIDVERTAAATFLLLTPLQGG